MSLVKERMRIQRGTRLNQVLQDCSEQNPEKGVSRCRQSLQMTLQLIQSRISDSQWYPFNLDLSKDDLDILILTA